MNILLSGRGGKKPSPVPAWPSKEPRSPFTLPQPVNYDHVLPFTPPGRDLYFYRGNFCGLTVPGAPPVPGGSSYTDLMMACLLDNYPFEWQDKFLEKYSKYFTHLQRSIGHSVFYGHPLSEHIALSKRVQQAGLFADEWFLGAEAFNTFRAPVDYWRPIMDPIISAMLDAGAVDHACVGWQLDQFCADGNPTIEIIKYFAERLPKEIPLFTHWVNEALAWWKDGGGEVWTDQYGSTLVRDRFSWWYVMQPYLTGGHHQGDVDMALTNPQLYQDKVKDTLDYFRGRTDKGNMGQSRRSGSAKDFSLTIFECTAQGRFGQNGRNNGKPWVTEAQQAQTGYILSCTTSFNGKGVGGYGNDACLPSGLVL